MHKGRVAAFLVFVVGCHHEAEPAALDAAGTRPSAAEQTMADAGKRLAAAVEEWTTAVLRENPETATSLAVSEERAGGRYGSRVSDLSREGMERVVSLSRGLLAALDGIDRAQLSSADRVTYDVLKASAQEDIANASFGYGVYGSGANTPYVVTQLSGAWAQMPDFLDSRHPIRNAQDVEDYLARLHGFATMLDQETARIGEDAKTGVVPPSFIIDGTTTQLRGIIAKRPGDFVLVQSLRRRAASVEGVDVAAVTARAEALVATEIFPALKRQTEALTALRKTASSEAGVWRLPKGESLYTTASRAWNTTELTPDEIHQMGLDIVAKNLVEMDALLVSLGKKKGSVAERIRALSKDKAQLYPNTDAGKTQLLADLNTHVAKVGAVLPTYFGVLPKAALQIKRVPVDIEQGSPLGYYQLPALDGSRPGTYYINLRNTGEHPKFELSSLTHHEGVPGHHFQIAIAQESASLPLARSALLIFSGYAEGWGLYAEGLADEIGLYAEDPYGKLGYLKAATFRAARLVVDTGLHAKHWSREQAIKYMTDTLGTERSSVITEVDRYCVWPGQATAYMVGREAIKGLRAKAQSELGERFDLKKFHDTVLSNGAMQLSSLERVVDDWVGSQKAAATAQR